MTVLSRFLVSSLVIAVLGCGGPGLPAPAKPAPTVAPPPAETPADAKSSTAVAPEVPSPPADQPPAPPVQAAQGYKMHVSEAQRARYDEFAAEVAELDRAIAQASDDFAAATSDVDRAAASTKLDALQALKTALFERFTGARTGDAP